MEVLSKTTADRTRTFSSQTQLTNEIASKTLPSLKPARFAAKGKSFTMGSPPGEENRFPCEAAHEMTLSADYYLGVTTVTRGQFAAFVKDDNYMREAEKKNDKAIWRNPGTELTDEHPVVLVNYNDTVTFCRWLIRKA